MAIDDPTAGIRSSRAGHGRTAGRGPGTSRVRRAGRVRSPWAAVAIAFWAVAFLGGVAAATFFAGPAAGGGHRSDRAQAPAVADVSTANAAAVRPAQATTTTATPPSTESPQATAVTTTPAPAGGAHDGAKPEKGSKHDKGGKGDERG